MLSPVLITGAGGFIGSHLTELCVAEGLKVKAFVHYNSNNQWGWLDNSPVKNDVEIITGDIRDFDSVFRAARGCKAIFHLAALIGIPHSYLSPLAYIRTNVEGTYNVLEAARLLDLERVLVTSTSETYGTAQYVPMDEKHPVVGQSPYAATKVSADQLAISYYRSFELPVAIVRPFNTYGPRQSARAFIPTTISQILVGKTTLQLGNVTPTRDLTFVSDTVTGFLSIAASDKLLGGATNIGMNNEISMGDLVTKIAKLLGVEVQVGTDSQRIRPASSEVDRLYCDNSRIQKLTSWSAAYNLESGLQATINWVRENLELFKTDIYNV